jgi:arylsulfatase A-like enzyme
MRTRRLLGFVLLLFALVFGAVVGIPLAWRLCDPVLSALPPIDESTRSRLPNVVLISLDTLRKSEMGVYDPSLATTPHLVLRRPGFVVFDQAIAQAPWTGPSHLALFYSNRPPVAFWERDVVPVTSILGHYGYETAAFTDGGWLGKGAGIDEGFDELHSPDDPGGYVLSLDEKHRQVKRWLDEGWEQPFFLFVHTYHTHATYDPDPDRLRAVYSGEYSGRLTGEIKELLAINQLSLAEKPPDVAPADVEYLRALYRAEILEVDEFLEELFKEFEKRGLWEEMLVVILSDHGESFFERGFFEHGTNLYDELVNVPLLVKCPADFACPKRSVARQVELLDLAPTILELVGVTAPATFEGSSFLSLFSDEARVPYEKRFALSAVAETKEYGDAKQSVRTEEWKYILHPASGREELYYLATDPEERHDRVETNPEVVADLRRLVRDPRQIESLESPSAPKVGPADREILKALGYIE